MAPWEQDVDDVMGEMTKCVTYAATNEGDDPEAFPRFSAPNAQPFNVESPAGGNDPVADDSSISDEVELKGLADMLAASALFGASQEELELMEEEGTKVLTLIGI